MKKVTIDLTKTPEGFNIRRASHPSVKVFFVIVVTESLVDLVVKLVLKNYPGAVYTIEDVE